MSARTSTSFRLGYALVGCAAATIAAAGPALADASTAAPAAATAADIDVLPGTTPTCSSGPTINTGSAGIDGAAAFFLSPASGFGANAGCTAVGAFLAQLWTALGSGSANGSSTLSSNLDPGSATRILGSLSSLGWTNVSTGSIGALVGAAGQGSVTVGNGVTGSAGLIPGSVIPVPVP
ncbi:hypothetical protein [Nocardia stercoris]|uniref:Secreted protein n=1 Tax=Nocardia stercoris TaxID=2483361 RepID=A0A3M2L246_9NOCA|nr:hypothetical protein [Nocardia stercoris]RMI31707.1 hypothetical protein EBN03_15990 [Nocardia stercoris]